MSPNNTNQQQLAHDWAALEEMVQLARWSWTETDVGHGQFEQTGELATAALNLCVLFALSVLERGLSYMRNEGLFASNDSSLYGLMHSSRNAGLTWKNFNRIDGIRRSRNALAHRQTRFTQDECLVMLLVISDELAALSIVSPNRELFMNKFGLSALNREGRRFAMELLVSAEIGREDRQKVFKCAEAAATESTDASVALIEESIKRAFLESGFRADIEYVVRLKFEPQNSVGDTVDAG